MTAREDAVASALQLIADRVDGPAVNKAREQIRAEFKLLNSNEIYAQVMSTAAAAGHLSDLEATWSDCDVEVPEFCASSNAANNGDAVCDNATGDAHSLRLVHRQRNRCRGGGRDVSRRQNRSG